MKCFYCGKYFECSIPIDITPSQLLTALCWECKQKEDNAEI